MIADKPEIVKSILIMSCCVIHSVLKFTLKNTYQENRDQIWRIRSSGSRRNRIQNKDFKGYGRGKTFEEYQNYTNLDKMLISSEYKHKGTQCSSSKWLQECINKRV